MQKAFSLGIAAALFGVTLLFSILFALPKMIDAYTLSGYKWAGTSTCVNTSSVLWPSGYNGSVNTARSAWNGAAGVFTVNTGTCGNFLYTGIFGVNGEIAFTDVLPSGSNIIDADTTLNFSYAFSTTMDPTKYYVPTILTHEMGHLLGLNHSGVGSAVMTASISPGDYRTVGADDGAGKDAMY